MKKNGIGPTTTGTTWTETHTPFNINHYQVKRVCQFKWHSIVFTILAVILMSLNEVQSTVSVANRPARNVQKNGAHNDKEALDTSLQIIHDIATENFGTLCLTIAYRSLNVAINTERYEGSRQKVDLAAVVLQEVGVNRHGDSPPESPERPRTPGWDLDINMIEIEEECSLPVEQKVELNKLLKDYESLLDALAKGLLSDDYITSARILATNITNGILGTSVWWIKNVGGLGGPRRIEEDGVQIGTKPSTKYPWFEDEDSSPGLRSPKFVPSPASTSFKGWWTYPYYSCNNRRWILSYSVAIPPIGRHGLRGFLSIDIDISDLHINQCDPPISQPSPSRTNQLSSHDEVMNEIDVFHNSHKCHEDSMQCEYRQLRNGFNKNNFVTAGWIRGAYQCLCKPGYYSIRHLHGFNGTVMEIAFREFRENISTYYDSVFRCQRCAPGCTTCTSPAPCLATYNWVFRISLLTISVLCAVFTLSLACYMYRHRKVKVFKVASPIFLTITLLGCAIMYLEMAAIFPILDVYSCIVTKWTRHMGFCVTYTALLMKTWRVSLTYRVKSAHKVKLTDKQLLQWMVPILLVMLIYLGTWTLSATPTAEVIKDKHGLKFKQCSYNWWDHSLAIGEVLFLAWGVRVCYNVRNAESLYNEARMISYAIYNIALVNIAMIAFHLFIFPQAGPDIKYLLGFIRTQLSTSTTIALVFGPKVVRVLRGQGDQWDNRAKVRGITASFSLNGIGLVPEDSPNVYQENEELKEEIQKLAAQMEFMKIVHMEINNRHIKPKPGGYFTLVAGFQSPMSKGTMAQTQTSKPSTQQNSGISEDGHSGTNSIGANSIGYPSSMHAGPNTAASNGTERV
ncbi:putative G-protein coupled receptor [Pseudolycoriella hygida]|uniref:G-protein coupled receptor n=1 Tax=Pseudolycoriella hygida TaxID=35572 RepID=A0A9Q0NFT0_9DIPT|nr:putative G-protein coupled receptor [Pseudolycoriella hygida]